MYKYYLFYFVSGKLSYRRNREQRCRTANVFRFPGSNFLVVPVPSPKTRKSSLQMIKGCNDEIKKSNEQQ